MNIDLLQQILSPAVITKDHIKDAMDNIDRVFVREGFSTEEPDIDVLDKQLAQTDIEIEELNKLAERVQYLRDNIDNLSDKDIIEYMNVLTPTFDVNEVQLATEGYSASVRERANLACEALSSDIVYGLLVLAISAILVLINHIMKSDFVDGIRDKYGRGRKSAKRKAKDFVDGAWNSAEEKYYSDWADAHDIVNDALRAGVLTKLNLAHEYNKREPGSPDNGLLADTFIALLDEMDNRKVELSAMVGGNTKDYAKTAHAVLTKFFEFGDHGVPIWWFAFNDKSIDIFARDLVNSVFDNSAPDVPKIVTRMCNLFNSDRATYITLSNKKPYIDDVMRYSTSKSPGEVGLGMEILMDGVNGINELISKSDTDNDFGAYDTEGGGGRRSMLSRIGDSPSHREALPGVMRNKLKPLYILPTNDVYTSLAPREPIMVAYLAVTPIKYISGDSLNYTKNYLQSLTNSDGMKTFYKWFRENHGGYDNKNCFESRLIELAEAQRFTEANYKSTMSSLKKEFTAYLDYMKIVVNKRKGVKRYNENNEPIYLIDLVLPGICNVDVTVGKEVTAIIKNYRDLLRSLSNINMVNKKYRMLAIHLDLVKK